MGDKDNYMSLGNNFGPFKPTKTHLDRWKFKLPKVLGNGGLVHYYVNTNPTTRVMAMHDVIEHAYSKIPSILLQTYASLA